MVETYPTETCFQQSKANPQETEESQIKTNIEKDHRFFFKLAKDSIPGVKDQEKLLISYLHSCVQAEKETRQRKEKRKRKDVVKRSKKMKEM